MPNPVEILAAPASFKADWNQNLSFSFSVSAHGLLRFVCLPSACLYIYNTTLPHILYFSNLVLDDGTKTLSSNIQLHSCVCVVGFWWTAYVEFSLDNRTCEKWGVSFFLASLSSCPLFFGSCGVIYWDVPVEIKWVQLELWHLKVDKDALRQQFVQNANVLASNLFTHRGLHCVLSL